MIKPRKVEPTEIESSAESEPTSEVESTEVAAMSKPKQVEPAVVESAAESEPASVMEPTKARSTEVAAVVESETEPRKNGSRKVEPGGPSMSRAASKSTGTVARETETAGTGTVVTETAETETDQT